MRIYIRKYPDPVLRQLSVPVTDFDADLRKLVDSMIPLMMVADGMGLAAPQVGVLKRVVVIDPDPKSGDKNIIVLVNPTIRSASKNQCSENEGCLSFPGISAPVKRAQHVIVDAQDLQGRPFELEGFDMLARCLQHEIDHLDGILWIDRTSPKNRLRLRPALAKLEEEFASSETMPSTL